MSVPFKNLTRTQINYLRAMEFGHLTQGWGGYNSTLTVRLLEERGLIRLVRYPHIRNGRRTEQWRASLTQAGKDWLASEEPEMITTSLKEKGDRLVAEDRVKRVLLHIYEVEGDTDTYTVAVSYAEEAIGRCDCKAGKQGRLCSHLFAAAVYELSHPVVEPRHLKAVDPFRGLS